MKDYIFTGLLILCVIIVGIGIYNVFTEEDISTNNENVVAYVEEKNENEEIEETQIEEQYANVEENLEVEEINTEEETNIEEEIDSSEIVEEEVPILNQIANKFNECKTTKGMIEQGYYMRAIVVENKINVNCSGIGIAITQVFEENENILTATIKKDVGTSEENIVKALLATVMFDCVGQVKGYSDGFLTQRLSGDESRYYTLENEGIEIVEDNGIIMKIDLNSNFDFLNN